MIFNRICFTQYTDNVILYMDFGIIIIFVVQKPEYIEEYSTDLWDGAGAGM